MDGYKLKIKIGEHEFEAQGPAELVNEQFAAFRELVATLPQPRIEAAVGSSASTSTAVGVGADAASQTAGSQRLGNQELPLDKIMRHDGRIVSLTARGATLEDEILLVMLGQRILRKNDSITGGEIADGLRHTGRQVNRIDYQLDKLTTAGEIITVGVGRARRYRLTNQGFAKAQVTALSLLEKVI